MTDHLPESPEIVLSAALCREFCACRGEECGHGRALRFVTAHPLLAEQAAGRERLREQRDAWVERRDRMAGRAREQRARAEAAERALADLRAGIEALADEWVRGAAECRRDVGWAWQEPEKAASRIRALLATEEVTPDV